MPATPPAPIIKGIGTIVWGTGPNDLGTPTGAIIESIAFAAKNGEPIEIEDGQGFTAVEILLDDGFNVTVTCVYDTDKTWPKVGDVVTLQGLANGGTGGRTSYQCLLASISQSLARKREATIEMHLTYRPGITLTQT